jgi:exodeoxyribonuclease VII small subunit
MAGKVSYEQAREELTKVVEQLEAGSTTLEDSLKLWERGEELAKICQDLLDGAKAKVNKEA